MSRRGRAAAALSSMLALAPLGGVTHAHSMNGSGDGPANTSSEAAPFGPPVDDQHFWSHVSLDQLEARVGSSGAALRWDAEAWAGPDAWRVVVRSEGQRSPEGRVEDGQLEALFSKPVTAYWDVQAGGRYDLDSAPGRGWAAVGVEGLAPQFVKVGATAYIGSGGRLAGKVKLSHDQLLTNRLVLQPEAELNLYSRDDAVRGIGSGFSDLDAGVRLRYEITRKFAPYVGVSWERKFGRTADFARAAGEGASKVRLAVGVSAWF
ncbi:MAG TPA: copper resistance protein B [Caulobacteraceae bacterium]